MYDVAPTCDLITQPYGCTARTDEWYQPACPQRYFHAGVDLSKTGGSCGEIVTATRSAFVRAVGISSRPALGPYAVWLDFGDGLSALYGHLATSFPIVGANVAVGAAVGKIGTFGDSTGCHLHYEIRTTASVTTGQFDGVVQPAPYLNRLPEAEPMRLVQVNDYAEHPYFLLSGAGKRWLTSEAEVEFWKGQGYAVVSVGHATIDGIPYVPGSPVHP